MGFVKAIPPMFENQKLTLEYYKTHDRVYDASDPGTGKTRSALEMIQWRKKHQGAKKALVFAPKSIMFPSWAADIRTFTPELSWVVAEARNRKKMFAREADIYITNTDAAKWISTNLDLTDFDILIMDECTAYKHRTSARAKAMKALAKKFKYRCGMSGTPNPNGVTDLWHQYLILDDGAHLGTNFWKFRNTVCEPVQTGPGAEMVKWVDRPGSSEAIGDIVSDMTIRHRLEDCVSIPDHSVHTLLFDLSASHMKQYNELKKYAIAQINDKNVSAVHKGALRTKLLQVASGAVYDGTGEYAVANTDRYNLVLDLIEEREASVTAFFWVHQKEQLLLLARKRGIKFGLIDGTVSMDERTKAVKDFQAGKLQTLFAHPMSAAHGLTLTRGTTTIWPGPIDDAERFSQFNRRIYRAGQTRKTETILVAANDTLDVGVYDNLQGKVGDMKDLLEILE